MSNKYKNLWKKNHCLSTVTYKIIHYDEASSVNISSNNIAYIHESNTMVVITS